MAGMSDRQKSEQVGRHLTNPSNANNGQTINIDNLKQIVNLTDNVYVISMEKIDGENCLFEDAIVHLSEQYMPVIVITDNYVIIKSECDSTKDNIFILFQTTTH